MWLINTTTLALESMVDPVAEGAGYAILSHTWRGNTEVSFREMADLDRARKKAGFAKIAKTCELARSDGLAFAWVDTCCIDKTSSAELSEAINSMFQWYESAAVCYVHLGDLATGYRQLAGSPPLVSDMARCRWFTRGWTLQELIAPCILVFFDAAWARIGNKQTLSAELARITEIEEAVLLNEKDPSLVSVCERMCWAGRRETTRMEDMAYCLLGIFDINMPLLYGEGYKAFQRLQVEIGRKTVDASLFAWSSEVAAPFKYRPPVYRRNRLGSSHRGPFAWAPSEFLAGRVRMKQAADIVFGDTGSGPVTASKGFIDYFPSFEFDIDNRSRIQIEGASLTRSHAEPTEYMLMARCADYPLCRPVRETNQGFVFLDEGDRHLLAAVRIQLESRSITLLSPDEVVRHNHQSQVPNASLGFYWANNAYNCFHPKHLWDPHRHRFVFSSTEMARQLQNKGYRILGAVIFELELETIQARAKKLLRAEKSPVSTHKMFAWFGLRPLADAQENSLQARLFADSMLWDVLVDSHPFLQRYQAAKTSSEILAGYMKTLLDLEECIRRHQSSQRPHRAFLTSSCRLIAHCSPAGQPTINRRGDIVAMYGMSVCKQARDGGWVKFHHGPKLLIGPEDCVPMEVPVDFDESVAPLGRLVAFDGGSIPAEASAHWVLAEPLPSSVDAPAYDEYSM